MGACVTSDRRRPDLPRQLPHHSAEFDIDERALAVGVAVMEAVVRELAG